MAAIRCNTITGEYRKASVEYVILRESVACRFNTDTSLSSHHPSSRGPGHHALPVIEILVNKVRVIDGERVVAGAQLDWGQPFSGAITVLIPATPNRIDLYKNATSDQSLQVAFNSVAPGDYKVIAWEDVPRGAYLNTDFLQAYEDRAQPVHMDRASSVSVQLKVIPRDQP